MKTKKFSKKLTLNKKTIADLINSEMKGVYGGGPLTDADTIPITSPIRCISYYNSCPHPC